MSSYTKNSNYTFIQKQMTLLEKKGTNTVSAEHCIRYLLPKVIHDASENILEKYKSTHTMPLFCIYEDQFADDIFKLIF